MLYFQKVKLLWDKLKLCSFLQVVIKVLAVRKKSSLRLLRERSRHSSSFILSPTLQGLISIICVNSLVLSQHSLSTRFCILPSITEMKLQAQFLLSQSITLKFNFNLHIPSLKLWIFYLDVMLRTYRMNLIYSSTFYSE